MRAALQPCVLVTGTCDQHEGMSMLANEVRAWLGTLCWLARAIWAPGMAAHPELLSLQGLLQLLLQREAPGIASSSAGIVPPCGAPTLPPGAA